MTLVNLLMQAGGIIDDGAAIIKVTHSDISSPDNDRITQSKYEQKTIQANQQLRDTVEKSFLDGSPRRAAGKKLDVQLSFKPESVSSTKGILIVKAGNEILLDKQLDIADLQERLSAIQNLINEPRISILQLDQKLSLLADKIQAGTLNTSESNPVAIAEFERISKFFEQDSNRQSENNALNPNMVQSGLYSNYSQQSETETGQKQTNNSDSQTVVLPVKGLNIPFADIELKDGDSIVVEKLELPLFSVLGLVNKPGNFEYPPDAHYSLMQAIAFANGLDRASDPRYATIYRLKSDGTIVHACFQVVKVKKRWKLTAAMNAQIKPGDIIIVEQTPRTRANIFFDRVFRVNLGTYFNLNDAWQ